MMSLFSGSQVSPQTSDASSMVPLSVVRQVIQEMADTRAGNLAFRSAISDHEAAEVASLKVAKVSAVAQRSGGRGASGGRGPRTMRPNSRDLRLKPPVMSNVPKRVPRNLGNQLMFDRCLIRASWTSSTGGLVENNFAFSFNQHPEVNQWKVLFDQYTIVEATVKFYSSEPPGGLGSVVELHTAIDFDNAGTNLSSLQALDDFGSCQVDNLVANKVVTRSVRPCTKADVASVASLSPVRCWMDCGTSTAATWSGIRAMSAPATVAGSIIITETALVFAFRNSI